MLYKTSYLIIKYNQIYIRMILDKIVTEAKKHKLDHLISGEQNFLKILQIRGQKFNQLQNQSIVLQIPLQVSKQDAEKIMKLAQEVKQKHNPELQIEMEKKLAAGNDLPNFGQINNVFSQGTSQLAAKKGQVLLIDVWATWCGPCQKPMTHNQEMIEKNKWGDKVRIVGVSVDDDVNKIKQRVQSKGWTSVEHLTLGGWDHNHSLTKSFSITGIPFVCLVDTNGKVVFTGHPSAIKLQNKINELLSQNGQSEDKKQAVQYLTCQQADKIINTIASKQVFQKQFGKNSFISTKIQVVGRANKGIVNYEAQVQAYVHQNDKATLQQYKKLINNKNIKFTQKFPSSIEVPPVPENCVSCHNKLSYPLYWCRWSEKEGEFRCQECINKKNEQNTPVYNQNSILLMEPTKSLPQSNMGNNIQPQNGAKIQNPHQFSCNSCGSCPITPFEARYICLGCRSQPNYRGDYVDLCQKCLTSYTKKDEKVAASMDPDGHDKSHAFVRILHNVKGYYEF